MEAENNNEYEVKTTPLVTIDGKSLFEKELPPLEYCIDKILPQGLFVLAGPPKIGKSWLVQQIAFAVATGGLLWDYQATIGEVLYLALEDGDRRTQWRYKSILNDKDGDSLKNIFFTYHAETVDQLLFWQIGKFIEEHPKTKLVIIDTLQYVRGDSNDKNQYVAEYNLMRRFIEVTRKYPITMILVTHTRKMDDDDPVKRISGTTGISGGVDGVFILSKDVRNDTKATLSISNRDTKDYQFFLEFTNDNQWVKSKNTPLSKNIKQRVIDALGNFMGNNDIDNWKGSASSLLAELKRIDPLLDLANNALSRFIKDKTFSYENGYEITVTGRYEGKGRCLELQMREIQ